MTAGKRLPDATWEAIRSRWQAGEPCRSIVRAMTLPISAAAIRNKAIRGSWERLPGVEAPRSQPDPIARDQRHGAVLAALADGATLTLAATIAGVNATTLANWRSADARFAAQCDEASAGFARRHLSHISKAGDRGDYKASQWLVSRHRLTREDYGDQQARGSGGLTIVLNIPRDSSETAKLVTEVLPALEQEE